MNKRIKELAREAGMNIVDDKFSTYGKFVEKFAELIIAECMEVVGPEDSYADIWFSAKADCVNKLRQHFRD
jgi:hypothetical protein